MATCSTTLLTDASCLSCLTEAQLWQIIACQLATLNGMSCDPSVLLADASCLDCLTPFQLLTIIACQVSQVTTGGSGVRQVYDSNNLPAEPADPTKGAIAYPYTAGGGDIKEWDVANQVWV